MRLLRYSMPPLSLLKEAQLQHNEKHIRGERQMLH